MTFKSLPTKGVEDEEGQDSGGKDLKVMALKGVEDEEGQESAGKDLKVMALKGVEDEEALFILYTLQCHDF
jgi:hypothetical protein